MGGCGLADVFYGCLLSTVAEAVVSAESGEAKNVHTIKNIWHAARPKLAASLRRRYRLQPGDLP